MGVDVCIYFKMRDGTKPGTDLCLPLGCSIADRSYSLPDGATHEIDTVWRYYGEGYERGPWPEIAAVLMTLMASTSVEAVWYFGDCFGGGPDPITAEDVANLCLHYMKVGNRPYYGDGDA